nr:MAG TPA: hypothetical protein [Caudoviricetes sp.]DAS44972.1 MAG TPA: hypothetical protein [Caudoviricetes sp.]
MCFCLAKSSFTPEFIYILLSFKNYIFCRFFNSILNFKRSFAI